MREQVAKSARVRESWFRQNPFAGLALVMAGVAAMAVGQFSISNGTKKALPPAARESGAVKAPATSTGMAGAPRPVSRVSGTRHVAQSDPVARSPRSAPDLPAAVPVDKWFSDSDVAEIERRFGAGSLNRDATENCRAYLAALAPDAGSRGPEVECRGSVCRLLIDVSEASRWSSLAMNEAAGQVPFKLAQRRTEVGQVIAYVPVADGR